MTFAPIILRGRGPISRAILELDSRTRGAVIGEAPNALISRTPRGVIIIPTASANSTRRSLPQRPVWG